MGKEEIARAFAIVLTVYGLGLIVMLGLLLQFGTVKL